VRPRAVRGRQSKTLTRDLNALIGTNLLARLPSGLYRARHELMFTYMPITDGDLDRSVLLDIPDELRELAENEQPLG
jgi:hypothetical protein